MIARDQNVWLGGYNLTGVMNALALELALETHDKTVFGKKTRQSAAGLKTIRAEHEGYFDAEKADEALFSAIGLSGEVMTVAVEDGAEGAVAYTFPAAVAQYNPGGSVGDLLAFSVSAEASGDDANIVRGTVLHNGKKTASDSGTSHELGTVAAGGSLFAALHVVEISGTQQPRLDVVVESGATATIRAPVARVTFESAARPGSQWKRTQGPIPHRHYRITWRLRGTTPAATFVVVAGIA